MSEWYVEFLRGERRYIQIIIRREAYKYLEQIKEHFPEYLIAIQEAAREFRESILWCEKPERIAYKTVLEGEPVVVISASVLFNMLNYYKGRIPVAFMRYLVAHEHCHNIIFEEVPSVIQYFKLFPMPINVLLDAFIDEKLIREFLSEAEYEDCVAFRERPIERKMSRLSDRLLYEDLTLDEVCELLGLAFYLGKLDYVYSLLRRRYGVENVKVFRQYAELIYRFSTADLDELEQLLKEAIHVIERMKEVVELRRGERLKRQREDEIVKMLEEMGAEYVVADDWFGFEKEEIEALMEEIEKKYKDVDSREVERRMKRWFKEVLGVEPVTI